MAAKTRGFYTSDLTTCEEVEVDLPVEQPVKAISHKNVLEVDDEDIRSYHSNHYRWLREHIVLQAEGLQPESGVVLAPGVLPQILNLPKKTEKVSFVAVPISNGNLLVLSRKSLAPKLSSNEAERKNYFIKMKAKSIMCGINWKYQTIHIRNEVVIGEAGKFEISVLSHFDCYKPEGNPNIETDRVLCETIEAVKGTQHGHFPPEKATEWYIALKARKSGNITVSTYNSTGVIVDVQQKTLNRWHLDHRAVILTAWEEGMEFLCTFVALVKKEAPTGTHGFGISVVGCTQRTGGDRIRITPLEESELAKVFPASLELGPPLSHRSSSASLQRRNSSLVFQRQNSTKQSPRLPSARLPSPKIPKESPRPPQKASPRLPSLDEVPSPRISSPREVVQPPIPSVSPVPHPPAKKLSKPMISADSGFSLISYSVSSSSDSDTESASKLSTVRDYPLPPRPTPTKQINLISGDALQMKTNNYKKMLDQDRKKQLQFSGSARGYVWRLLIVCSFKAEIARAMEY
eukprot:Platyproteum_vivax@DN2930_c0_g1_i2.p1